MKKTLLIAMFSMLVVLLALGSGYAQSSSPGNNPPPQSGWYCPNCGSYQGGGYGMGPGMMGGRGYGYGMGPGMMGGRGGGYGMGPGMMGGQGYGYGMGPGMMGGQGYGYGMGPGMMGSRLWLRHGSRHDGPRSRLRVQPTISVRTTAATKADR